MVNLSQGHLGQECRNWFLGSEVTGVKIKVMGQRLRSRSMTSKMADGDVTRRRNIAEIVIKRGGNDATLKRGELCGLRNNTVLSDSEVLEPIGTQISRQSMYVDGNKRVRDIYYAYATLLRYGTGERLIVEGKGEGRRGGWVSPSRWRRRDDMFPLESCSGGIYRKYKFTAASEKCEVTVNDLKQKSVPEVQVVQTSAVTGNIALTLFVYNPFAWRVVKCCKVSWHLLMAVHSRCMQQEPVTTVLLPGETECIPTTHKRAARDLLHASCGNRANASLPCNSSPHTTDWAPFMVDGENCILSVYADSICVSFVYWLDYSPPTGSFPDFRMWESCRAMPLVGGFSRGSPFPLSLHSGAAPYSPRFTHIGSQGLNSYDGNTARLARRSDEALGVRVSVARIAPSLLDLCRRHGHISLRWSDLLLRKHSITRKQHSFRTVSEYAIAYLQQERHYNRRFRSGDSLQHCSVEAQHFGGVVQQAPGELCAEAVPERQVHHDAVSQQEHHQSPHLQQHQQPTLIVHAHKSSVGMRRRGKREIPRKPADQRHRPAGTIPSCEIPGVALNRDLTRFALARRGGGGKQCDRSATAAPASQVPFRTLMPSICQIIDGLKTLGEQHWLATTTVYHSQYGDQMTNTSTETSTILAQKVQGVLEPSSGDGQMDIIFCKHKGWKISGDKTRQCTTIIGRDLKNEFFVQQQGVARGQLKQESEERHTCCMAACSYSLIKC
ncbi:hypothetical protein PR048_010235 [Dryococelus australis]|uniref:Uncharacterized protein n=1 Tax=Dryococelus australis TaxID=614101 RepID=A0ABQ9I264_9NEOP|nr:hypothetical protein PR048_010235 [Dryococelus australis]